MTVAVTYAVQGRGSPCSVYSVPAGAFPSPPPPAPPAFMAEGDCQAMADVYVYADSGWWTAGSDMRRRRSARARSKCRSWPQCCLLPGALRGRAVGCGEGTRSGDLAGVSQRYARMRSSWCTRRSSSTGELLVVHLHGAICQAASQIGHWLPPCFCAPLDASQQRPV
jgi:hypothetical protein